MDKAPDAFRTISEVAEDLDVPQHVLRFWETRFPQVKPLKRGGGRRYYRPADVDLLRGIRHLLYGQGYTIRGVQRLFREQGARFVAGCWRPGAPVLPPAEAPETGVHRPEGGAARDEAPIRFFAAPYDAGMTLEAARGGGADAAPEPGSAGAPADPDRPGPASAAERIEELRTAAGEADPFGDGMAVPQLSEAAVHRLRGVLSELLQVKGILDGA